jgi:hypothetical protein
VTGGGVNANATVTPVMVLSYPVGAGTGWFVQVKNTGSFGFGITVFAVCVTAL